MLRTLTRILKIPTLIQILIFKLQMALTNLNSQENFKAKLPLNFADFLRRHLLMSSKQRTGNRISSKLLIDFVLKIKITSEEKRLSLKMTQTTFSAFETLLTLMPLLQLSLSKENKPR